MSKRIYQIYARERCLMDSIPEDEFETTWKTMNNMVGILKTDYTENDLSYREITISKED